MCQSIAYALAAATGTREESERPAEWKTESGAPESEEREREEPPPATP